jgi:hypothetical protein
MALGEASARGAAARRERADPPARRARGRQAARRDEGGRRGGHRVGGHARVTAVERDDSGGGVSGDARRDLPLNEKRDVSLYDGPFSPSAFDGQTPLAFGWHRSFSEHENRMETSLKSEQIRVNRSSEFNLV